MKNMFFAIGSVCVALTVSGCGIVSGGFCYRMVRDQYEHPSNVGVQPRSIPKPPAYYVVDVDEVTGVYAGPFVRLHSAGGAVHHFAWHGDHYVRYHPEQVDGKKVWTFRGD
ncbi:MAG: hypothetical protein V1928_04195 [Parcubacteria group bacterium]